MQVATKEGWDLRWSFLLDISVAYRVPYHGKITLAEADRLFSMARFGSDQEAQAFVAQRASEGSRFHIRAWAAHCASELLRGST